MFNQLIKKIGIYISSTVLVLSLSYVAPIESLTMEVQAHSGRTDAYGGHHDYKNRSGLGSYHYHHGYPAHLHPNGVCPYGSGTVSTSNRTISNSTTSSTTTVSNSVPAVTNVNSYNGKYKYATDEVNRRVSNNEFAPEILAMVPNYASQYLNFLSPEELADFQLLSTNDQNDIMNLITLRVYDILYGQYQPAPQIQNTDLTNMIIIVQTRLKEIGFYNGEINGIFDVATQQALINFQITYGLAADGTINAQIMQLFGNE